jgi:hypothetical protein
VGVWVSEVHLGRCNGTGGVAQSAAQVAVEKLRNGTIYSQCSYTALFLLILYSLISFLESVAAGSRG